MRHGDTRTTPSGDTTRTAAIEFSGSSTRLKGDYKMALGPKKVWTPKEVEAIRQDKKAMTVTQLIEKYQLRRSQIAYALYYYIDTSGSPSEEEGIRGRIKRLFEAGHKK
jgi:hypothetical protein